MVERVLQEVHKCCRECTVLCRNARTLADLMQLRDWTVDVEHDPPADAGAYLTILMAEERKSLKLRHSPLFAELDEFDKRVCLTHELVHPLLRDLYETVRRGAQRAELSGAAYRVLIGQVELEVERATDMIANIIAPTMPPLEW